MKKKFVNGSAVLSVLALFLQHSRAATLFWSADGTTAGGAGTWDTTSARWGSAASGPFPSIWNNVNVDSPSFGGTAGTVTLSTAMTVNSLITTVNGYIFSGSPVLTFSGANAGVVANHVTSSTTLSCNYTGSILNKSGTGRLELNNSLNTIGKYKVTGGFLTFPSVNRFGTAPASLVADYFNLDGGGLAGSGATGSLGATRGITIGAGGAFLGNSSPANSLTINGPITRDCRRGADCHYRQSFLFPHNFRRYLDSWQYRKRLERTDHGFGRHSEIRRF
ncbi:hypothetical protein [Pedosphaera parvula]|uniref:hypothetical protein n=1 Tax=Pedosphaera parvula TaxID=1032527 RepID=UPI001ED8D285|nr:hypothetical protein [Pedosphaera parvula]